MTFEQSTGGSITLIIIELEFTKAPPRAITLKMISYFLIIEVSMIMVLQDLESRGSSQSS